MIGFDFKIETDDTGKVVYKKFDSVTLPADDKKERTEPPAPVSDESDTDEPGELEIAEKKKPTPAPLSESSKLEISTDQYGLITSESTDDHDQLVDDREAHDYEWFLNELRKETDEMGEAEGFGESEDGDDELPPSIPPEHQVSLDSPPEQPQPETSEQEPPQPRKLETEQPPAASVAHGEAIDKFISEFKKEVDKLTGEEAEKIDVATVAADKKPSSSDQKADGDLRWVEGMEKLPPDQVRKISQEIVVAVAKRVAEQIVARIEPDVIYHLIKNAVDAHLEAQEEEESRQPS
jgi:hypothetical protein